MKTVLVADDEAGIRALYKRELTKEGYNVVFASDAKEAIVKTKETCPDLVVMDIKMPGMDGVDAMQRILDHNHEVPIVLNSAYSAYRESYLTRPADAYITKSSDLSELKETIHKILEEKRPVEASPED
jgi:CheY-like chemotaxis protein